MLIFLTGLTATLGMKGILILLLAIFLIVSILKKLFKLAVMTAVVAAVIHFGWPMVQGMIKSITPT